MRVEILSGPIWSVQRWRPIPEKRFQVACARSCGNLATVALLANLARDDLFRRCSRNAAWRHGAASGTSLAPGRRCCAAAGASAALATPRWRHFGRASRMRAPDHLDRSGARHAQLQPRRQARSPVFVGRAGVRMRRLPRPAGVPCAVRNRSLRLGVARSTRSPTALEPLQTCQSDALNPY